MAVLTEEQKAYIVASYAMYDGVRQIQRELRDIFEVEASVQQINKYNGDSTAGNRMAKKWRGMFNETRKRFMDEKTFVPISNKIFRLRGIQHMYDDAMERRNFKMAMGLLEQAAKESGEAFTNTHRIKASGKIEHAHRAVTPEERRNSLADHLQEAIEKAAEDGFVGSETQH